MKVNLFYFVMSQMFCGSSHREVFCKKGFLKNIPKFTGKQRSQSLLFNKLAGARKTLEPESFLI